MQVENGSITHGGWRSEGFNSLRVEVVVQSGPGFDQSVSLSRGLWGKRTVSWVGVILGDMAGLFWSRPV